MPRSPLSAILSDRRMKAKAIVVGLFAGLLASCIPMPTPRRVEEAFYTCPKCGSLQGGFFGSYDTQVPAAKEFMQTNWTPRAPDYETTSIRQFVEEDEYNGGIEPHGDPDRNRQVHFLNDDESPKRPLL